MNTRSIIVKRPRDERFVCTVGVAVGTSVGVSVGVVVGTSVGVVVGTSVGVSVGVVGAAIGW
jgi:hypothetical protein